MRWRKKKPNVGDENGPFSFVLAGLNTWQMLSAPYQL